MRPPPPQERLPIVFHLAIIKDPAKDGPWFRVVLAKMQGDTVLRRKILEPANQGIDEALAEFNRVATRVYYFGEGEEHIEP